jgi:hypothetical protein
VTKIESALTENSNFPSPKFEKRSQLMLIKDLQAISSLGYNEIREMTSFDHLCASAQKAAAELEHLRIEVGRLTDERVSVSRMIEDKARLMGEVERLRALLREAWMLTGGEQSPAHLREFHDRLDAQAYELGLRLPR